MANPRERAATSDAAAPPLKRGRLLHARMLALPPANAPRDCSNNSNRTQWRGLKARGPFAVFLLSPQQTFASASHEVTNFDHNAPTQHGWFEKMCVCVKNDSPTLETWAKLWSSASSSAKAATLPCHSMHQMKAQTALLAAGHSRALPPHFAPRLREGGGQVAALRVGEEGAHPITASMLPIFHCGCSPSRFAPPLFQADLVRISFLHIS